MWLACPAQRYKAERDKFHEMVLHGEILVFIASAVVATVVGVESGSTSRNTFLATEVQKGYTRPTMLHGATPPETRFS